MIDASVLTALLAEHGLWLLAPLAVLEGPVVTVLAGWMVAGGVLGLWPAFALALAGDLLGDLGFYLLGRRGLGALPRRWRRRLGLSAARVAVMARHFRDHGWRTLVLAKLTHAAGAPTLVAAGAARMALLPFVLANVLAAVPKVAVLMALGWAFGATLARVEGWITRFSLAAAVLALLAVVIIWEFRRKRRMADAP